VKADLVFKIGHIISYTNNIVQALGFSCADVEGQNVSALMPPMFGRIHNKILHNFI
jgi:hypothetical protein